MGFFQRNFDNNLSDNQKTFSLFLKCNQDKNIQNWSIFAKAELTLLHPTDPKKNFVKSKFSNQQKKLSSFHSYFTEINHLFNSRSDDWGYNNFKTIKVVHKQTFYINKYLIIRKSIVNLFILPIIRFELKQKFMLILREM